MSELDLQKEIVGWYKDLFKWILAVILAVSAGLVSLLANGQTVGMLFYIGLSALVVLTIYAVLLAKRVTDEIKKLRDL